MNLLSVIHYPVYGGPHNRNARLEPLLAEQGVTTTVLLPSEVGNAAERLRKRGVNVVTMELHRLRANPSLRVQWGLAAAFRREVAAIRGLIRCLEIDVVLINGLVNPHAAVAARLEGVAVVWQLLDTFPPMIVRRALMPVVCRLADVLMVTGMSTARSHPGALTFGETLISFFPPVDVDVFRPRRESKLSARAELGLEQDDLVVGNVGNLNPMKGHGTFIRAGAALRGSHPGVKLVILGATYSDRADYVTGLRGEAEELGLVWGGDLLVVDPGGRVSELAPAFDVFWLSAEARSEGVPTAIGEAMALEQPVVATSVGAVREAVADQETGFLVAPGDPDALAEATRPILEDATLRARLGKAGRERAIQTYAAEVCAASHLRAFEMAITRQSAVALRRRRAREGLRVAIRAGLETS